MSTSSSAGRLGLLAAEIRLQIYQYLLVDDNDLMFRPPQNNEQPDRYHKWHLNGLISHCHVEILRTCRLTYSEALPVLYGQNTFRASSDVDINKFLHSIGPLASESIRSLVVERSYQGTYEQALASLGSHQLHNLRILKLDITVEPNAQHVRVEDDVEVCRSFVHDVLVRGCYVSERLPASVWTVSCRVRNHSVHFSFRSDPVGKRVLDAPRVVEIMIRDRYIAARHLHRMFMLTFSHNRSVRFKYSSPPHTMVYESAWRVKDVIRLHDMESATAVCQIIR